MDDIFTNDNKATGGGTFFKFANVGDKISGKFVSSQVREAHEDFPEKKEYTLETPEGNIIASISTKKTWVIDEADKAEEGDILGFLFSGLGGKNKKAKNIDVYLKKQSKDGEEKPAAVPAGTTAAEGEDLEF